MNKFFVHRTDFHKTINTILITHHHIDHDFAPRAVVENFTVQHLREQRVQGAGAPNPTWFRGEVSSEYRHIDTEEVPDSLAEAVAGKSGLTAPLSIR